MSQDTVKYRNWIRESFGGFFSPIIYNLGKALIQELEEEKGTALIVKQVEKFGRSGGEATRKAFESQGKENSLDNYFSEMNNGTSIYNFAWEGGVKKLDNGDWVEEWNYCPVAEGFKNLGEESVKIGELFCNYIDNAVIREYNPDYEYVRERSLNRDGLCRLHAHFTL
jgi:hypothetical protein